MNNTRKQEGTALNDMTMRVCGNILKLMLMVLLMTKIIVMLTSLGTIKII